MFVYTGPFVNSTMVDYQVYVPVVGKEGRMGDTFFAFNFEIVRYMYTALSDSKCPLTDVSVSACAHRFKSAVSWWCPSVADFSLSTRG